MIVVNVIYLLAGIAITLVIVGAYILSRRDLELGALFGIIPLQIGVGVGFIAFILFAINHIRLAI